MQRQASVRLGQRVAKRMQIVQQAKSATRLLDVVFLPFQAARSMLTVLLERSVTRRLVGVFLVRQAARQMQIVRTLRSLFAILQMDSVNPKVGAKQTQIVQTLRSPFAMLQQRNVRLRLLVVSPTTIAKIQANPSVSAAFVLLSARLMPIVRHRARQNAKLVYVRLSVLRMVIVLIPVVLCVPKELVLPRVVASRTKIVLRLHKATVS
jgi:hypothetical protein